MQLGEKLLLYSSEMDRLLEIKICFYLFRNEDIEDYCSRFERDFFYIERGGTNYKKLINKNIQVASFVISGKKEKHSSN